MSIIAAAASTTMSSFALNTDVASVLNGTRDYLGSHSLNSLPDSSTTVTHLNQPMTVMARAHAPSEGMQTYEGGLTDTGRVVDVCA